MNMNNEKSDFIQMFEVLVLSWDNTLQKFKFFWEARIFYALYWSLHYHRGRMV